MRHEIINMKHLMRHVSLLLIAMMNVCLLASCGDDNETDEPGGAATDLNAAQQLMSTSWEMIDDGDGGDIIEPGTILTFEKNGNLSAIPIPDEVIYAKWEAKGKDTLTITVNFGDPLDDYLVGNVQFTGDMCVFTFRYFEQDHFESGTNTMKMKRIK